MKKIRSLILIFFLLLSSKKSTIAQNKSNLLKVNVLNLIAKGPSLSFEKVIGNKFGVEMTYASGTIKKFIVTDYYNYAGLLLRGKYYFDKFEKNELNSFGGIYVGVLNRKINTKANGWLVPERNFVSASVRFGGTLGYNYLLNENILFEFQTSLGYGVYPKSVKKSENVNGYIDAQISLNIGFAF